LRATLTIIIIIIIIIIMTGAGNIREKCAVQPYSHINPTSMITVIIIIIIIITMIILLAEFQHNLVNVLTY